MRIHRAVNDSSEAERTNAALGDAVVVGTSLKWEYFTFEQFFAGKVRAVLCFLLGGVGVGVFNVLSLEIAFSCGFVCAQNPSAMTSAELEGEEEKRTATNLWATAREVQRRYHMARGSVKGGVIESFLSLPLQEQFFSCISGHMEAWIDSSAAARPTLGGHGLFSVLTAELNEVEVGRKFMQYRAGMLEEVEEKAEEKQQSELFTHISGAPWAGVPQPVPDLARLPLRRHKSLLDTIAHYSGQERVVPTDTYLPSHAVDALCASGHLTSADEVAMESAAQSLSVDLAQVRERVLHNEHKDIKKAVAKAGTATNKVDVISCFLCCGCVYLLFTLLEFLFSVRVFYFYFPSTGSQGTAQCE
jgi:hypothetical protein